MNRTVRIMTVAATMCAGFVFDSLRAEEAADESAQEVQAESAKPKKRPKKLPEYANWDKALETAEAWEQPVIAFVELKGDKVSAKVKGFTFNNRDFLKEFVTPNAVYYHLAVPSVKEKQERGKEQKPPKPDRTKVKESERPALAKLGLNADNATYPVIAVVSPTGKVLKQVTVGTEGAVFGEFVASVKEGFEAGHFPAEISKKLQKLIDTEAKKVAELEKRQRK